MIFDTDFLYKIIYEMTTVFESSKNANELILGLKQVFKNFLNTGDLNIYIQDEFSSCLKNFIKPWEMLQDNEFSKELYKNFGKLSDKQYIKTDEALFFPIYRQRKICGIAKLDAKIPDGVLTEKFSLISKQISLAIINLKYYESAQNNTKFYETVRSISKITDTQYDLSYILPIMGEMIDGFISEHLIYIFIKKKDFKLVWPNKCLINNIKEYLSKIKGVKPLFFEDDKIGLFPLIGQKRVFGAIVAYNPIGRLQNHEIQYLEQLTAQASITVNRAKEYMRVLENATLDALTGLNNRHMFYERLIETTSQAQRRKTNLCCIMTDIDFFKFVNDTYGHAVGDLVLKTVAKVIKKELRQYDIPSRYGGEEFAILLPNTPLDEACKVAQRLRAKIEKKKINIEEFKIENVKEISVTISIGVALYDAKIMTEPANLYQKADKALYIAKESGRNRVVA